MSKDKLTDYDSTTASNNTDVGGISVAEGMLPSAVNNSIRELTKQLGAFADGTDGIDVLSLADDDASHAIKLQAPSAVTADTTFTLPDGDGASGQAMVTDGAGTLSWAAPYGNRNLIINGAMQVAQRGASVSGLANSPAYIVDRFSYRRTGAWSTFAATMSQENVNTNGLRHSLKLLTTATENSSDGAALSTALEGLNLQSLEYGTSNAKAITVSFWVKSSTTGTHQLSVQVDDLTNDTYPATYTIDSADTFEHKTVTIPAGSTSESIANDNTSGLDLYWVYSPIDSTLTAGSWQNTNWYNGVSGVVDLANVTNGYLEITGVQLEVGEQATPFEHRSYGDELARCQRYCFAQARYGDGNIGTDAGGGTRLRSARHSSNASFVFYQYPVMMRANPDLTFTDNSSGTVSDYGNAGGLHIYDGGDTAWYLYDLIAEAEL